MMRLCGRIGIRTPETLSRSPVFKTGAFNHSAILPKWSANLHKLYNFPTDF